MTREVEAKEHELDLANQDYYDLQGQLEHMLATITKETNDMKKLETGLREGELSYKQKIYIFSQAGYVIMAVGLKGCFPEYAFCCEILGVCNYLYLFRCSVYV